MPKPVTFEEALERFADRDDIILCEDGWNGWKVKSKFFDKILNEEWWAVPHSVHQGNRVPLKRKGDKAKKTNLKKYGVESYTQTDEYKEKSKKTNLKKYGVEYNQQNKQVKEKTKATFLKKYGSTSYLQTDDYKEKSKKTNLQKYGVEYYTQTKEIQEHIKNACIEKFGVEYPSQSDIVKAKKEETCLKKWGHKSYLSSKLHRENIKEYYLEKYGVEHFSKTDEYKEKYKQTCLEKYGVENSFAFEEFKKKSKQTCLEKYGYENAMQSFAVKSLLTNRFIKDTEEHVRNWLNNLPEPKPSYITVSKYFGNREVSLEELENFVSAYKANKTSLELRMEEMLGIKHFNCQPNKDLKYKPDFKLTETIFANIDGLYWHSELNRINNYHFQMRKDFEDNGLRIFQFYQNELLHTPNIIKSIVENSMGLTNRKIFARKCSLSQVNSKDANEFLGENHLMGTTKAKHVGLYFEGELVSLMSYKVFKDVLKIERFCSKANMVVIGSFSKLLKNIESQVKNISEVHNWVDLRYGNGLHLKDKGFELARETLGWKWTDGYHTFNRLACRANMDERRLTESQHANEKGWYKIYDAGQRLWIKKF